MWWLIFAAPAALVAYELVDDDRRAVWEKRWAEVNAHTCEFGEHCGRIRCRGPRRTGGYRARESVNPRTVRPPRSPTAVTPPRPRAGLDTSDLQDLLADAKQGLDRRNGGSGLRAGGKIGLSGRRALTEVEPCYTCGLLNQDVAGPHEHPFEDLVAAERAERDLRHPRRSKALWDLVKAAES